MPARSLRVILSRLACLLWCWSWGLAQAVSGQLCPQANTIGLWQGLDGWLFSEADLRSDFPISSEALERLGKAFSHRGSSVVFVILPPRAILAHDYLDESKNPFASYAPAKAVQAYRDFLQAFETAGFLPVDLSIFDADFYFKTDHHWTPAGAKVAAQAVAERVKGILELPEAAFVTSLLPEALSRQGSYVEKIVAEDVCPTVAIPAELYPHYATEKVAQELGLFTEATSEVVLVGTSNSTNGTGSGTENNPRVNFIGFLQDSLRADVVNAAISGGGGFIGLENYLVSSDYETTPPKLLVWETLFQPLSVDAFRFDDVNDYRRIIPSVYGSCRGDALQESEIAIALVEQRVSSLARESWRTTDVELSSTDLTIPDELGAVIEATFKSEDARLIIPYQTDQELRDELLQVSFWAWTASESSVEARLVLVTQPEHEETVLSTLSLTSVPRRFTVDRTFVSQDKGFNLRLDNVPSGTRLYLSSPEVVSSETVLLRNDKQAVQGHDFYVELAATDTSLVNFNILVAYQNGAVEKVLMRRDRRIRNTGRYFLELSDAFSSSLQEVRLELPPSATGKIEARLCQVPE
jgi:SGNH hydrolase-like domain, acetyltransferase AlgX